MGVRETLREVDLDWRRTGKNNKKLVLSLFIILCIIFLFTLCASRLTTYDAMRGYAEVSAKQPTAKQSLHTQYLYLLDNFTQGAELYTYEYGGLHVTLSRDMVNWRDENKTRGIMLNLYSGMLYHGDTLNGDVGKLNVVAGYYRNNVYTILMWLSLIAMLVVAYGLWWGRKVYKVLADVGIAAVTVSAVGYILIWIVRTLVAGSWNTSTNPMFVETYPAIIGSVANNLTLYVIFIGVLGLACIGLAKKMKDDEANKLRVDRLGTQPRG
jgi:hypothetical protein